MAPASGPTYPVAPKVLLTGPDLQAVSGISTHLNNLLSSDLGSDFELLHFPAGSPRSDEPLAARVARLAISPGRLVASIRRHRPDVVHVNSTMDRKAFWRDLGYLATVRAAGAKHVVLQIHGGQLPDELVTSGTVSSRTLRSQLRMADSVVLLSDMERRAYEAFDPDLPLEVIPNAVPVVDRCLSDTDFLDGRVLHIAFLGRLIPEKGLFEAVDAVRLLRDRGVPVELRIAGRGPAEQPFVDRVDALGLRDQVSWLGAVSGGDKTRLWDWADVFLLPTFFREGLPYALLEAMASAVVPVTCPVGAIPDAVDPGTHGLFVEPHDGVSIADALEWIHHHRAEARAMGRAARARVLADYTIDRLVRDLRRVYSSLLTRPSGVASGTASGGEHR